MQKVVPQLYVTNASKETNINILRASGFMHRGAFFELNFEQNIAQPNTRMSDQFAFKFKAK